MKLWVGNPESIPSGYTYAENLNDAIAFNASATYNFMIAQPQWTDKGEWGFYAGPGAQVGFYNAGENAMALNLAVGGQIGAEWAIPAAPINITLDWRPMFYLMHGGFGWDGFALGLRYRF